MQYETMFNADDVVVIKNAIAQAHISVKNRALAACNTLAELLDSGYLTEEEKEFVREQIAFVNSW